MTDASSYSWPAPAGLNERRAILTRAAVTEARRQATAARGDLDAVGAAEAELRRLWQRHSELEARERVA